MPIIHKERTAFTKQIARTYPTFASSKKDPMPVTHFITLYDINGIASSRVVLDFEGMELDIHPRGQDCVTIYL